PDRAAIASGQAYTPYSWFCFVGTPSPPGIYTPSLHDALPISAPNAARWNRFGKSRQFWPAFRSFNNFFLSLGSGRNSGASSLSRSEEHTSELQSRGHLVCRLLLEKKKTTTAPRTTALPATPRE